MILPNLLRVLHNSLPTSGIDSGLAAHCGEAVHEASSLLLQLPRSRVLRRSADGRVVQIKVPILRPVRKAESGDNLRDIDGTPLPGLRDVAIALLEWR